MHVDHVDVDVRCQVESQGIDVIRESVCVLLCFAGQLSSGKGK